MKDLLFADVDTEKEAYAAAETVGLRQKAEELNGYVFVIGKNDGNEWTETDLKVFKGVEQYILGEGPVKVTPMQDGTQRIEPWGYTFGQRTYVFAEGDAATFANKYLSTYANRIAGLCLVGGDSVPEKTGTLPVPAFLANVGEEVIQYYNNLNNVDTRKQSGDLDIAFDSKNIVCRTVVSKATKLDKDVMEAFWQEIGRCTSRMCLHAGIWMVETHMMPDPWVLVHLPVYEELGITRIDHNEPTPLEGTAEMVEWYEFVPNSVLKGESGNKKYPLLVVCHGSSDHPVYEAESQGWVEMMGKDDLIILTLRHQTLNRDTKGKDINRLVDHIIEKYPIDASRVYIAGFSMGGSAESLALTEDASKYAAVAVMHTRLSADFSNVLAKNPNYKIAMYYGNGEFDSTVGTLGDDRQLNTFNMVANLAQYSIERVKGEEDLSATNFYGLGMEGTAVETINNMDYLWKEYPGPDKIPYIKISVLKGAAHVHFSGNAEIMWPFMSQFSRNLETGELVYTPRTK